MPNLPEADTRWKYLVRRSPSSVRRLIDQVGISQPAVSQHLKVLREASLVDSTPRGASNIYAVNPAGIELLRAWVESRGTTSSTISWTPPPPPVERSQPMTSPAGDIPPIRKVRHVPLDLEQGQALRTNYQSGWDVVLAPFEQAAEGAVEAPKRAV